jgi:hypothetical protein
MVRHLLAYAVLVGCTLPLQAAEFEIKDTDGKHADIVRDGKTLVRYMYARDEATDKTKHNTYKVYYHVFDPSGEETITKGPGGKYTHHRGLFIGFSKLTSNGATTDLWHMKNTLQRHVKFVRKEIVGDTAILSSAIHWTIPGATIVEEIRTLTVHHDDEAHLVVDFVSELKAIGSDAKFGGDPEHAGMQYRPHNGVAENKSAKYVFPQEDTNVKEEVDLPWVGLTYQLGDATYSVQHMNHPENPTGTRYSAYRDYGRFGAFPVFEVREKETRALRYRIRVTLGELPSRKVLHAEYKKFVGS